MPTIFSYGTFRDPFVQQKLFGRAVPLRPATLQNYALHKGSDGYHGILPCAGISVSGALLSLSERELTIADGWEICPTLYIRRLTSCETDTGPEEAWVYFRTEESSLGDRIADPSVLCTVSHKQLARELDEYLAEL